MYPSRPQGQMGRFFAGLTEHAFQTRLGVADPPLVEYIGELLTRFVHCDKIFMVRDLEGKRLEQVVEMLVEAEGRVAGSKREVHRHIGDFTLFWTGVYPEALKKFQKGTRKDHFLDYCEQGKRSYHIASTIPGEDEAETQVLERLSHEFELCVYGLGEIRKEWERREGEAPPAGPFLIE